MAMILALGVALGAWAGMVNLSTLTGDYVVEDRETLTFQIADIVGMETDGTLECTVTLAYPADGGKATGSGYCPAGKKVTLKATLRDEATIASISLRNGMSFE